MNEYFVVYDQATGEECYRAQVSPGVTALQLPAEGTAIMLVSEAAFRSAPLDLALIKLFLASALDVEAELLRANWITPGSGQAMSYLRKEERARQHLAGAPATPILAIEAGLRGITTLALAQEIVASADAWEVVGGKIDGHRIVAKERIAGATNLAEIAAARKVDWVAILTPLLA